MEENNSNQTKNNNDNSQKNSDGKKKSSFSLWWVYALIFIPLAVLYFTNDKSTVKEITWTEFQQLAREDVFDEFIVMKKKEILEAIVKSDRFNQVFKQDAAKAKEAGTKITVRVPSTDKFSDFFDTEKTEHNISAEVVYKDGDDMFWNVLVSIGPILLIVMIWIIFMRRMSGGEIGRAHV